MTPALQIRMSSLVSIVRICFAPAWIEVREAKSSGMNVDFMEGNWDLRVFMRVSAREAERPVKRM